MERLFGGHPVGVIIRLVVLSIVVGIAMSALDIRLDNILHHLQILVHRVYNLGFGVFEWLIGYLLIGAVVVIPVWLIVRLLSSTGKKSS